MFYMFIRGVLCKDSLQLYLRHFETLDLFVFFIGDCACVLRTSMSSPGYDMSTFIRRYSRYLNEKAFAYRQMAFDFGRVKKGYCFSFLTTPPCCMTISALLSTTTCPPPPCPAYPSE